MGAQDGNYYITPQLVAYELYTTNPLCTDICNSYLAFLKKCYADQEKYIAGSE